MSTLPTSGYTLDRVFAQEQSFTGHRNSEQLLSGNSDAHATFGWDWQIMDDRQFLVSITVGIEPTRERPESIRVMTVGVFTRVGEGPAVDVLRFVQVHAPSILMPYARETISALSGRGFYGALYLPPLNVQALMNDVNIEATTGLKQARENPRLGNAFGVQSSLPALPAS